MGIIMARPLNKYTALGDGGLSAPALKNVCSCRNQKPVQISALF